MRNRHVFLAVVVVVLTGLALGGCLGPAVGDKRITAYDVVAVIREDRTVAVREVIDWDFGSDESHGIFRTIPATGGAPTDVEVTSPDAPDQFALTTMGADTEIKIGDADKTITGRHRYVISYVLPATIEGDRFALDAIGDQWAVGSERVTITVLGADLTGTECFTGPYDSTDRCPFEADGDAYRTAVSDLGDHEAVTVIGDIAAIRPAELPAIAPFEGRSGSARLVWAGIVAGLGALTAVVVYVVSRQLGRNEVAGGGAVDAAFGDSAFGPDRSAPAGPPPGLPGGTRLVADSRMGELAGLEFVPPGGVEPWQAAVVLRERIDDRTIGAWFSSLAAHDVVTLTTGPNGASSLRPGPRAAEADAVAAPVLNQAFGDASEVRLGTYDARFATAWAQAGTAIDAWTHSAGVFRRRPPRYGASAAGGPRSPLALLVPLAFVVLTVGGSLSAGLRSPFAAVAVPLLVVGGSALLAYRALTRSLTARGSAIALRAESFRRFLHDSEAQHVEWAWQNGLLREYSAWAVALGEADAWNSALSASSVAPAEASQSTGVLSTALYASSFTATTVDTTSTASSSSGGGFDSGSFSGGDFSGGGGGGGGGDSW